MESFFTLRAEKQTHIITAALTAFSENGFKKTSLSDISEKSGISKSMILYYFGSKKNLYIYLIEFCKKRLLEEIERFYVAGVTDFFDRIRMMTDMKMSMLKKNPAVMSFFAGIYFETDDEVMDEIGELLKNGGGLRDGLMLGDVDRSNLKDDVDPQILANLLTLIGEGFAGKIRGMDEKSINEFIGEFYYCLDLMKKYFSKS